MRISDLLEYTVHTSAGAHLGQISDVRIVQDGPVTHGVQAAFRVDALIVGRGGLAERLGYVRGGVEGPWMLRVLFSRLERRVVVVPVADIARWDDDQHVAHLVPDERRATRPLEV